MAKNKKISVQGVDIILYQNKSEDFISLTYIARHKDPEHTDSIIQNWMRNRNTLELLGFWETIYNPNFKPLEFEGFRKQAGISLKNERLLQLNKIAMTQMKSLLSNKSINNLQK